MFVSTWNAITLHHVQNSIQWNHCRIDHPFSVVWKKMRLHLTVRCDYSEMRKLFSKLPSTVWCFFSLFIASPVGSRRTDSKKEKNLNYTADGVRVMLWARGREKNCSPTLEMWPTSSAENVHWLIYTMHRSINCILVVCSKRLSHCCCNCGCGCHIYRIILTQKETNSEMCQGSDCYDYF